MKINLTVEVSDEARRYIAALLGEMLKSGEPRVSRTTRGLARRADVRRYLQLHLQQLRIDYSESRDQGLTVEERRDISDAIAYLRAQGKSDSQIRAWLLMQRARLHFSNRTSP